MALAFEPMTLASKVQASALSCTAPQSTYHLCSKEKFHIRDRLVFYFAFP